MEQKFTQWSQLIMCGEIKPNEKIVLMVILNCNNMAWPFIAHTEIMKQSGLKETSVKEAIKSLRKMGLITKVKTDINNMNNYIASGVNLASLITSGSDFDPLNTTETTSGSQNNPQVGRKTPDIYNINKKDIVKKVKENIKEKKENNEIINGKLNRKDEVKEEHSNNNIIFNKKRIYMELDSQSAKQEKNMKIVQFGDSPTYLVKDEFDDSSILASIPSASPSREKKRIQQIIPSTSVQTNVVEQLSNEDETNAPECLKTANTDNNGCDSSMDCGYISIDELENMYNGGQQTVQSKPISSAPQQTTTPNNTSHNGGGRNFTPKKEWENQMKHIQVVLDTDFKGFSKNDWNALVEGANDKYRVIETLIVIEKMLKNYIRISGYGLLINTCGDTLDDNKEAYTEKQYKFAWEMYDRCEEQFEKFIGVYPKLNK